ncbi:penicillin-binding protein 1C [Flavobacterium sp. NRK F10]|uniref:penicillin-binding protein 1C n=1 Tax=Flavobacterium sp. NRK F10 TaxID=2954931 RepID=UPI002091E4C6|nr:penicillin-binding protein 1C [Flavobacterium sp. NRK F10]MCO6174464.1 penicillin-binding protein 1C [Flavobacterium sp. NRK F10]
MQNKIFAYFKRHKIKTTIGIILVVVYYFSLPRTLFKDSYATVIESSNGQFLGAKIANDGQWRFPESDSVPYKFRQCIVAFEDQYFYKHIGFNPVAMLHAFQQNRAAGKVVRGGSTLTQQVIRLYRKNAERSYLEKFFEVILATRLESRHSKDEILNLYASHAPFGGNVVGLEMASWRYFGLQPHQLSWAEAATLAVLPNAPRLIYPGKNQELLLQKRDRLLHKLWQEKIIDKETYDLALLEPLPQKPYAIPKIAPHLTEKINQEKRGQKITTTIDYNLQERVNEIVAQYYNVYKQNKVFNMAVVVVDVKTRKVLSYVGNSPTDKEHQKDVDVIQAPRSTGSILKPFLYAAMLDEGELLSHTLVPDIPTQISGYSPQNYNYTYDGAVPASRALARSLNIPAVLMLKEYSVNRFYEKLQKLKQHHINRHPSHYGLSLILGGAETSLWDLCGAYAYMASTLNHFTQTQDLYRSNEMTALQYIGNKPIDFGKEKREKNSYGAGAIWQTFNAMKEVNRPEGDEAWRFYDSSLEIAWKTGTSFGGRDAWAVGVNPDYVVGVWVGNATGEGRPLLTGVESAAPVLFDVFRTLPRGEWFNQPYNDMEKVMVCKQSGYLAQENCPTIEQWIPRTSRKTETCPYHKMIHLDKSLKYTVNSNCEKIENIVSKSWFILPPVMEWYYKSKHVDYIPVPPLRDDCKDANAKPRMAFIYPSEFTKIILTKDFNGIEQPVILKVAHSNPDVELFWYIDDQFLGTTRTFHEKPLIASNGLHWVTVVDENGNEIKQRIVIERSSGK